MTLPPIRVQKSIGEIADALEAKIANNRALAADLEATARAIFKSWFVDFDPVKAKMEGRAPAGMDADTAALFPDELVESELGLIPKGWGATHLGNVVSHHKGRVKHQVKDVQVLSAVASGELVLPDEVFSKQVHSKDISNYFTVPINSFAYNPSRINIGSIGRNITGETGAVSPVYVVVKTGTEFTDWFDYWRRTPEAKAAFVQHSSGSVRQSLSYQSLASIPTVVPKATIAQAFSHQIAPLLKFGKTLDFQSDALGELRDTLIPRLISGKLRLPE